MAAGQGVSTIELNEPIPLRRTITNIHFTEDLHIDIADFDPTDSLNTFIESCVFNLRIGLRTPNEVIMELVGSGADINNLRKNDRTPLMHAVVAENYELVTVLLNNGADIRQQTSEGKDLVDIIHEEDITLSGDMFVVLTNAFAN